MYHPKTLTIIATVLLAGCAPHYLVPHDTKECMQYRGMMTAPLAPDAMSHLRNECEQSRKVISGGS